MTKQWIVVADAGGARIFSKIRHMETMAAVQELDNAPGRAHTSDLVSDHRGQVDKGGTGVMSAMQPPTDPHEQQAIEFARKLGDVLERAAVHDQFDKLNLVAPPHFLGLLRAHLGAASKHRLDRCAAKDFTHVRAHDIGRRLQEVLPQVDASAV
jgi:protein required for attachment to host cells